MVAHRQGLNAGPLVRSSAYASITREKKKIWSREWLKRKQLGCYENLMRELALEDKDAFRRWLRMDTDSFEYLLGRISHKIARKDTNMRRAIPATERLALTLRFLATGETQSSLFYQFRIAQCTISGILSTVCRALYDELAGDFMCVPSSNAEWREVAKGFETLCNYPLCIGALVGKHVRISPPVGSGSQYFNYKGNFSIILLALVDAEYKFIYVDVGKNGRCSDGGVWSQSTLKKALDENTLSIPEADFLPGTHNKKPHVLIADDAFPLTPSIMKPYSGRNLKQHQIIFNCRLSRARRVMENAFGILANRFRIYKSDILANPVKARSYVLATCILHNFLRSRASSVADLDKQLIEPNSMDNLRPLPRDTSRGTYQAKIIRETFSNYFNVTMYDSISK